MITLLRTDSAHENFVTLVHQLDADLAIRDGEDHAFYAQFNKIDMIRNAVVAYADGQAIGCGVFKPYAAGTAEIKRMYVRPEYRGQRIAGEVPCALESWAQELGYKTLLLETGKAQPEAIRLYTKSGYQLIPNYGQYAGIENSVCMEKVLQEQVQPSPIT